MLFPLIGLEIHKELMYSTCKKYDDAELEFRLGNSNAGEAIIGPHRNATFGGGGGGSHTR